MVTGAGSLAAIVMLPAAGALIPALAARRGGPTAVVMAALLPVVAALGLLAFASAHVFDGEVWVFDHPWAGRAGLDIALRLDGLSLLFAGLILVIGVLVLIYARYYLGPEEPVGRFYALLLGFMTAMLGVALSDNLILLIVFWELTSLLSFLLVGFWSYKPDARAGARMALAVTGAGGLALLAGALLLRDITGTLSIAEMNAMGDTLRADARYPVALVLVLAGAFTKSAQVPFHFWLPGAMAAPTPVSAYLHSATMVKAGVFLLARLYPALSGSDLWFYLVGGTGLVTLVFASWQAVFRHDLKSLLAYSTISHLGLLMLLLGLNSPLAAVAAVFHIINHATFKASLFMAAGIIDHETGSRDMRRLNGLWRYMPATGLLATVAAASMAGVPFLNGFLSKEMLFAETLDVQHPGVIPLVVPAVATLAGIFAVAYSIRFIHDVFFNGEPIGLTHTPHDPPRWMRVPVEVLVVVCVLVGIAPAWTVAPVLDIAARALLGGATPEYSLALWHGFNLPLAMSAVAFAGGTAFYFWLQKRRDLHGYTTGSWTGHRVFEALVDAVSALSERILRLATGRGLQWQTAVLVVAALLAGGVAILSASGPAVIRGATPPNGILLAGGVVLVAATAAVVLLHRQRLAALVLTSAVGLFVAATFAYASAPDLALTQLVVEAATVLLLLLALPFFPAEGAAESSRWRRVRDGIIALVAGIGTAAGSAWMMTRGGHSVSAEHAARSVPEGGGTNVVNVILVDFRGFDTYGEITVLAIAALGIVAMLAAGPDGRRSAAREVLLPRMLAFALVPLALVLALHLFLRGHNLPGGGFIAGLVVSGVLVFGALLSTQVAVWSASFDARRVMAWGLAVAGLSGAGAWLFGKPFLTSAHGELALPWLGKLHWASAALFDLGVMLVVVGVVLLILRALVHAAPVRA